VRFYTLPGHGLNLSVCIGEYPRSHLATPRYLNMVFIRRRSHDSGRTYFSALTVLQAKLKLREEWTKVVARCQRNDIAFWDTNLADLLASQDTWISSWIADSINIIRFILEFNEVKFEILQEICEHLNRMKYQDKSDKLREADSSGVRLLHRAIEQGAVSCVKLLLQEDADIEQKSKTGKYLTILRKTEETIWDVLRRSWLNTPSMDQQFTEIEDLLNFRVMTELAMKPAEAFDYHANYEFSRGLTLKPNEWLRDRLDMESQGYRTEEGILVDVEATNVRT
jgi:hypothetical protein